MPKTLVVYCTHVINKELNFFLDHGYIKSPDIDFCICLIGDFNVDSYNKKCKELKINNLRFYRKENKGYDFGGWTYIINLEKDNKKLYELYDYFIFLNGTCVGPFIPMYCNKTWVEIFTKMIKDNVKLVGPTINHCGGKPHVQSYFMCTDKIGLGIGISNGIFKTDNIDRDKMQIVNEKEIAFSLRIIDAGYNIKSLLKGYEKVKFNKSVHVDDVNLPHGSLCNNGSMGDPCYTNSYFGISIHPYEVIFYKSNRDIDNNLLEKYMQFYQNQKDISKYIFTQIKWI